MDGMNILHFVGSNTNFFWFRISYLYGAESQTLASKGAKAYFGVQTPKGDWYICKDALPRPETGIAPMFQGESVSGDVEGPLSFSEFISKITALKIDVAIPHMFDAAGMTSYRGLFEDILKIAVVGPTLWANVVAQHKGFTNGALQDAEGVLVAKARCLTKFDEDPISDEWIAKNVDLPAPYVVKPALEDNSRGVGLVKTESSAEERTKVFAEAFSFGPCVIVQEFIPGREMRAGVVERGENAEVWNIPALVEYILPGPIRTHKDKLEEGDNGAIKQSKTTVRNCPAEVDPVLREKLEKASRNAHRALGFRDYGLFDFRVHEATGEPYIIEACAFWSFSPISAITLLLKASDFTMDQVEDLYWEIWTRAAKRTAEMKEETKNLKMVDDSTANGP